MDFLKSLGDITLIAELITTVVVGVYTIYAFLVLRQTKMLNEGFRTESEKLLNYTALIHFVATLVILFIGIILVIS